VDITIRVIATKTSVAIGLTAMNLWQTRDTLLSLRSDTGMAQLGT